jgi:hypothetical protein
MAFSGYLSSNIRTSPTVSLHRGFPDFYEDFPVAKHQARAANVHYRCITGARGGMLGIAAGVVKIYRSASMVRFAILDFFARGGLP